MKRLWYWLTTWSLVYLPVLLMLALALGSFWLLRQTPDWSPPKEVAAPREVPEVIVSGAQIRVYDEVGALQSSLDAERLLRYQASGIAELEGLEMQSNLLSGAQVQARAVRARANADMTEVQLIGAADMWHRSADAAPAHLQGDFMHFFIDQERVESHLPISFNRGRDSIVAGNVRFDQLRGTLDAAGGVKVVLDPAD